MATVVFGGLGAALGSVIPGAGWLVGMQVGMGLGALFEQQQALSRMEIGKVADRTVSGSSYGAGLPIIWGRWRLGGNVVWADKDSSGNHLFEFSEGGGKGGGPSSYRYEATVAALFCAGELVFPDGSSVHRHPDLIKLWGDDQLVYEAGQPSRYVIGSSLHYYDGAKSQAPSSVIIAKDGLPSAEVCAYRGRAYAVMQDIGLDGWGNRVPNWSAVLETDPVTFADLFSDLCRLKGLNGGQIDGSLATMPIKGACLMDGEDPLDLISAIAQHFACDMVDVDGVLKLIPRGGSVTLTVPGIELGTSVNNDQRPKLTRKRPSRRDLPSRVEVRFLDIEADLQQATQSDFRPEGSHQNTVQADVPLALTADDAAQRAAREMDQAWEEADELEVVLPLRRIGIAPADPILMPTARGLERCRVTRVHSDPLGEVRVTAIVESAEAFSQSTSGAAGGQILTPPSVPVPTAFLAWSGREIQDSHQGIPGFYVAASGATGWQGGTIYWSPDGGSTWLVGGSVTQKCVFGEALSSLSNSGAAPDTFDTANTVQVDVADSGQTLFSASDTEILAGKNHAVLGSEILGVGIASVSSPGIYTLSRLRRGERATPMGGHATGERFVMLGPGVARVTVPEAQIGTTIQVKVVSPGQVLSDVTAQSLTIAAPTPQTLGSLGVDGLDISDIAGLQAALDGKVNQISGWTITNPVTRKSFDTTTVTLQELAESVGTLVASLE